MLALLWLVRIYKWWLIAWVLMTWIPGLAGSEFHNALGIPILPVLSLFGFLQIGFIGLQAVLPLVLLTWAESALMHRLGLVAVQPAASDASASAAFDSSSDEVVLPESPNSNRGQPS